MPGTLPVFDVAEVNSDIAATEFHNHLHHLASTASTNDLALKAALAGKRIGVWIADQQIAGRGRGAHRWHSPAGSGLYMSVLIAPRIPMQNALALSLRVAIAVQSAIVVTTGFTRPDQIDIRWPNDLLLNGRKVGGILIDTASNPASATKPSTLRYAVIGIGLNLNQTAFPPELDAIATSLYRELYSDPALVQPVPPLRREPLAAAILLALDTEIRTLAGNAETSALSAPELAQCSTWITGKRVRVEARDGDPGYTGTTAGLNPGGFLLVAGDDGQIHTVLSGGLREP